MPGYVALSVFRPCHVITRKRRSTAGVFPRMHAILGPGCAGKEGDDLTRLGGGCGSSNPMVLYGEASHTNIGIIIIS